MKTNRWIDLDREADNCWPEPQHAGPVGDWENQSQVHQVGPVVGDWENQSQVHQVGPAVGDWENQSQVTNIIDRDLNLNLKLWH